MKVSPKYMIKLLSKVEKAIWDEFKTYKNVEAYMNRWIEIEGGGFDELQNFYISRNEDGNIDLRATLHNIKDDELLFKIAVDMGVEVPDLIYSIPEIKGILSSGYEKAAGTFENAYRKVSEEPATAICCANSALESIIKHICEDETIADCNPNDTLYDLVQHILKEFKFYPSKDLAKEIRNIGSGLLNVAKNIEDMRSKHTDTSHGKAPNDYIIDDELYAKFIVNAVTTIGLFLMNFYEKRYLPEQADLQSLDDVPF